MTTLFNPQQYQNSYQHDWDGAEFDPAWDKSNDVPKKSYEKVSPVEETIQPEISDRWNPNHFGETPRKLDANSNPTVFWDESIEPPLPDDFNSLKEYEEAWQEWETENSDNSICAAEWEQDSLSPDCSLENLSLSDSQKSTSIVAIASPPFIQESTITEISSLLPLREVGDLEKERSTLLPHRHPANPSQFRESDLLPQTSETVSPQCSESLKTTNQNTSASKMLEDYSTVPLTQEAISHISDTSLRSFTAAGTMQNGYVYLAEPLPAPSIEEDYCWLPAPTALSTRNSRPPGLNKLETFLKKNELIKKGEVLNPVILSEWFSIPETWLDPSESQTAAELLALNAAPPEISLTPESPRSHLQESCTSTHSAPVKEPAGEYSTTLKAISLWQPWASLIPLGLKHYETRSWKTNYRGKLLICSTAANSKQHKEYLKICNELELPAWENFSHGCAIAICDLVDCIEMTPKFIAQQSQTELLCGDWQVGRYAWKLENIQPITEPFAVKGKQGLFNVSPPNLKRYLNNKNSTISLSSKNSKKKSSDCWYTPPHIVEKVVQVLGTIDLDPCADDGKHLEATQHFTVDDDGLNREWHGRVFMNPPYSCPGAWMKKLQAEFESGRVREAIALVPAATDTNWLNPVLKTQPVCFWKGRIKFLDTSYQPKLPARQSHVLVYWGENWKRFREVFDGYGFVSVPSQFLEDKLDSTISSRNAKNEFLEDKLSTDITSRKTSEESEFLEDNLSKDITSRKIDGESEFLEDNLNSTISSRNAKDEFLENKLSTDITSRKTSEESEFLEDNSSEDITYRKMRRRKGEGSGCIYYRSVTKKGKEYQEAYYQYEIWNSDTTKGYKGDRSSKAERAVKSSKYIPKRLLSQVQRLEVEKAPVKEILQLLGVNN